jgi:tryptophan-rich sensory protein
MASGSTIAVAAVAAAAVALTGGLLTEVGPWYKSLRFPSWRPPNWLFGPAWTVIFFLIAWSGVVAWQRSASASEGQWLIALFVVNGGLNILWSALFFKLRRPDWALAEVVALWLSILALVVATAHVSTLAGWLMFPYLAWVSFAGVLNLRIVQMNRPFDGRGDAKSLK